MTKEDIRGTIIAELPKILRTDKKVREVALRLLSRQFADKRKTEDRIDRMLRELAEERIRQDKRWEEQKAESDKKWEEQNRKWEEQNKKWQESKAESDKKWEEQNRKWEEQNKKWQESKAESDKKWEEQNRKWEEQNKKWQESKAESDKKWEEQNRKWEEQNKKWWENQKEHNKIFEELKQLSINQNNMMKEIKRLSYKHDSTIGALGARWGLRSEKSFRNALSGILKETSGFDVENVTEYDNEGIVYGRPDQVELDIIIKNGQLYICEIKSSMSKSDMVIFKKKADFYQRLHNRQAQKLIVISPMVDEKAITLARHEGIVVYSYIEDIVSELD